VRGSVQGRCDYTTSLDIRVLVQDPTSAPALLFITVVCVYYYSTYYKDVRVGGGGAREDMCYERLRAVCEACVD
jgi:hypothetical protein